MESRQVGLSKQAYVPQVHRGEGRGPGERRHAAEPVVGEVEFGEAGPGISLILTVLLEELHQRFVGDRLGARQRERLE